MTGVAEHAEHMPQLIGLGRRGPCLVVAPPPRREKPRPGAVALRQRAGREDADCNDGEDDDCGDLLGEVTENEQGYIKVRNPEAANRAQTAKKRKSLRLAKICEMIGLTPLEEGTQVGFWLPIKIPAEYVSLMPRLPENAKNKILRRGTYFTL